MGKRGRPFLEDVEEVGGGEWDSGWGLEPPRLRISPNSELRLSTGEEGAPG